MSIKRKLILSGLALGVLSAAQTVQTLRRLILIEGEWDIARFDLSDAIGDRHEIAWKLTDAGREISDVAVLAETADAANEVAMKDGREGLPRPLAHEELLSIALRSLLGVMERMPEVSPIAKDFREQLRASDAKIAGALTTFNRYATEYNQILGSPFLQVPCRLGHLETEEKILCEAWESV